MQILIPVQQMTVSTQIVAGLVFDLLMNTFYLYPAVKVQALSDRFKQTVGTVDLKQIVKEHQLIIE